MSFSFSRSNVRRVLVYTAVFFFLAHGFRFLVPNFSDDSLLISQTENTDWQISLGRFMQPIYWRIRGDIPVPSVIGFLSYFFLACATCVVCSLLGLTRRSSLLMLCMALTANATFAIANSSYISWTDVYMLSFLCCALCVYVTAKYRFGFLGGAPILFAGLGLYQSYLETAIVLFLLVLIRMTLEKQPLRDIILFGLKALFVLLTALLLYAAVYSLSLRLTGIQAQSAYNGLASVGKYDDLGSMLRLLGETYLYPFQYLFRPESHLPHVVSTLYLFLLTVSFFELVQTAQRRCMDIPRLLFLLAFTLLLPLGLNAVYFISKGITYALTFYAFFLMAALPLMLLEYGGARLCLRYAVSFSFVVIYGCSLVFSSQLYTLRELEFRSTLSLVTRVLNRVELTDGYVAGETSVVFAGNLYNSPLLFKRPGFESSFTHTTYALTYESTYAPYFNQVLGYRVALPDEEERARFANRADVRAMPVFPAEGSIQMIDGVLVVHIGRQQLAE